ncbi:MAG: MMPL family transporter [Planctomycetota bacterium]|nr:MMPL family transporter [Planctomycetota bacterium]
MRNAWVRKLYLTRQPLLLLAILAMTVLSVIGFQRFSFDNEARGLFRTNDSTFDQLEEIFEQFRPDENDCLVVLKNPGSTFFTANHVRQMQSLMTTLEEDPLVSHVVSIFSPEMIVCDPLPRPLVPPSQTQGLDWRKVEKEVLAHPIAGGNLITPDGQAMMMVIQLGNDDLLVSDYQPTVDHLKQIIVDWRNESGIMAYLTGLPPVRVEIFRSIKTDTFNLMLAGALVAVLIALVAFRNWALAFMAVAGAGIGSFWALGLLSLTGVKINLITTILPVLVVVIGLTDAVHLVFDIRESRVQGIKPPRAAWIAVRRLGIACAFTSITTAIGFGSLSVSSIEVIRQFGITCAVGTMITFLAVMLIVPWLASTKLVGGAYRGRISRDSIWLRKFSGRYADFLLKYRYVVLGVFGIFMVWMTITTMRLYPDSHIVESIPKGSEAEVALREVDQQFGGMLSAIVLVQWDPAGKNLSDPHEVLRAVESEINQEVAMMNPMSILNFNAVVDDSPFVLPKSIVEQWYRPDLGRAIVVARLADQGMHYHRDMIKQFRERMVLVQVRHEGYQISVSGSAVVASRNLSTMINDLVKSLVIAAAVIILVLSVMFRSVKMGLVSLLPNCLPLLFTASYLVWTGEPLRLTSVLLFTVSLGIAVDDTIHFLVRFRREQSEGKSVDESIRNSITSVGAALVVSTLVLIAGFSASAISVMPHSQLFSKLACISVGVALIGDMVLLPVILRVVYRDKPADL